MKVLKTIKSILGVTNTKAIPTDKKQSIFHICLW